MAEWDYSADIVYGQRGARVRLVQEWLSFHGQITQIDGAYGTATRTSVKAFQQSAGLPQSGDVDRTTFDQLVEPIVQATQPLTGNGSLAALTLSAARQHLGKSPREIGGNNCGPWVRLYMHGREGDPWAWCAGFATMMVEVAAHAKGVLSPYPYEVWVPNLAALGKAKGTYFKVKSVADQALVKPGYLFLVPGGTNFWSHVGIVLSVQGDTFRTIEGNMGPSPDGVISQIRALQNYDYLRVA